jgi:4-diphosphocytidyl-2-C-methyl-D-erythritol kinase
MSPSSLSTSQPAIRLFAPAKINWALTIRGRRADGYHDLDTVFQALDWGDELVCRRSERDDCQIECDAPGVPTGPENLVWRAWRLMRETFPGRVGGLAVRLIKRVPAGAGLGGGSSDAVAALRAVDRLYGLRLGCARLEELAAGLGSDCPFFVRGGTALAGGRGERLRPIVNRLGATWLVVAWPGFPSSTAEAYRRVGPEHYEDGRRVARVAEALESGNLDKLFENMHNCFSTLVFMSDLRYKRLQEYIIRERLRHPMLSGSGSAMFAFADDGAHGRRAAERLRQCFPVVQVARPRRQGTRALPGR